MRIETVQFDVPPEDLAPAVRENENAWQLFRIQDILNTIPGLLSINFGKAVTVEYELRNRTEDEIRKLVRKVLEGRTA